MERATDCRGSGQAKADAARGQGDDPYSSPEPRIEAVAGKKAGAWRN